MVATIYRTNPDGTLAVVDENPRDDSIHDMDAVRRYIPNYDFLREQSQRYNAYTSSNGTRQEIALLYRDENGRLSYVPTPEELDARVKIAQSPYARFMGPDGQMAMIALVDENGRYIPSPLDGVITAREAPDIISGDESFYDGSREGPPVIAGDESFYDGSREGPPVTAGDESFYDGSREGSDTLPLNAAYASIAQQFGISGEQLKQILDDANAIGAANPNVYIIDIVASRLGVAADSILGIGSESYLTMTDGVMHVSGHGPHISFFHDDSISEPGRRQQPIGHDGNEHSHNDSKTYQDVWRYDIDGIRGALGAYNPSSEPLTDLWRGDPWARFDGSKTPDRSAMEHDHRQKTDWDFNVDGPIRGKGEYVQALPDRMISSHERGEELSKYVQALPDRMISEYETRSDAQNSFRDRNGNTLSSQGIQNIHELQAQLSTAGLLNKNQGQRDDPEPKGNEVKTGQEAAVVAQR